MNVRIFPRRILIAMLLIIFALLIANIFTIISALGFGHRRLFGLVKLFSFREELNIPTLYSSLQLFAASVLLFLIGSKHNADRKPYLAWMIIGAIFLLLSIDEIVQFHERSVYPIREQYDLHGIFYFSWVIPGGIAVVLFTLSFAGFLLRLPKRTARRFVACGIVYVIGAIGFEMLGARLYELHGPDNIAYATLYTTEELLEMLGISFFVYTLLDYLAEYIKFINVQIRTAEHEAATYVSAREGSEKASSHRPQFPIVGSNDEVDETSTEDLTIVN